MDGHDEGRLGLLAAPLVYTCEIRGLIAVPFHNRTYAPVLRLYQSPRRDDVEPLASTQDAPYALGRSMRLHG